MNILIVENSSRMRRTIRSLLGELAHEIFECEDGNQAVSDYELHRPDWVLMDIGLKELDGIVITGSLKAAFPDARVIIVTDYDDARLRQAAQDAGACGYVLKQDLFQLRAIMNPAARPENEPWENKTPTV